MDWNMPLLDGIETTKEINNSCQFYDKKPTTIIMVSSFRQESIVKLAHDVGIDIFLQKPINPSVLNDILSAIFLKHNPNIYIEQSERDGLKQDISVLKGSKILLVEDNTTNQEIMVGLLENSGIEMEIANNGKEAVEVYEKGKYELILMDIQMPVMDGYEATRQIRETDKEVPIIALTANAMKEDIEKTKQAKMDEHLNKPIEVNKLYEVLFRYLKGKDCHFQKSEVEILKNSEHIDFKNGLSLMGGDEELYMKILKDFSRNYKDVDLSSVEDKKRFFHTIKGLSANIGAKKLHNISVQLDKDDNKDFYDDFKTELQNVLEDITLHVEKYAKEDTQNLKDFSADLKQEFLQRLKKSAKTRRTKVLKEIFDELRGYSLDDDDKKMFEHFEVLVDEYKFREIVKEIGE